MTSAVPPSSHPVTAGERAWLWGAILAGMALRFGWPDRIAVEHFDEAIYAANTLFGAESNYQYPGREFYAPPLLPLVIEWLDVAWSLLGDTSPRWWPILPGLMCGCATIPSLWWIARRWFGPDAALVAAWSLALCEFHAAYSRTALTDVPLTLCFLWAVYWLTTAMQNPSPLTAGLGSLCTALAWWTKYNGWLPLAIVGTASLLVLSWQRAPRAIWQKTASIWMGVSLLTGLLWLPVWFDCQDVGGYAAVAANHRRYLEGWSAWMTNARRQFEEHGGTYAGWLTVWGLSGPSLVVSCLGFVRLRTSANKIVSMDKTIPERTEAESSVDTRRLSTLAINALSMLFFPGWWFPFVIGLALICSGLALRRAIRENHRPLAWSAAVVWVWVLSLLLMTPLYRAYPRLCLPLLVGSLLGTSIFWRRGWLRWGQEQTSSAQLAGPVLVGLVGVVIVLGRGSIVGEDRAGYLRAAQAFYPVFHELSPDDADPKAVAYALAEPGLFYHLRRAGVPTAIAGDTRFLDTAPRHLQVLVAIGPLAGGTKTGQAEWLKLREQWELLAACGPFRLSSIVRLDQDADWQHALTYDEAFAKYAFYRWRGPSDPPR